ncbi:zinc-ribbon domain-containing protein, partial [Methanobrevibacter sp.]|uniref:zinc-ribbon domain-containing protein n=1 Tax=Methanobrevibacter sp. TaxID=66852 RepID=UPI002E796DAE
GLLSNEEFASLKQELLSENNNEKAPVENNIEASTKYCGNCGAEVSPDNAFCTECGTQINNN